MSDVEKSKPQQPLPENAKKVFEGTLFDVWQWEQVQFDGSVATYEKVKRRDTVFAIPVNEDGMIIITKQEQPGMDPFYSLPGGKIEDGEKVLDAGRRELIEETGYDSENISLFYQSEMNSYVEWFYYYLIAKDCKKVGEINPDSGEKIEVMYVTPEEFVSKILKREFRFDILSVYFAKLKEEGRINDFYDALK